MNSQAGGLRAVETVSFEAVNDHIVLQLEGGRRALLDTGSPYSFGVGTVTLLGERFQMRDEPALMDLGALSRNVGTQLDLLLGMDVLARVCFLIEWEKRTVTLSREPIQVAGCKVPLDDLMGCPIIEFTVAGRPARGFLDTGATISYLGDDGPRPVPIGRMKDFHPSLGGIVEFETPLYRLEVTLGDKSLQVTTGELPELLRMMLSVAGVSSILGSDVWKKYDVLFDLPGKRVVLVERGQ